MECPHCHALASSDERDCPSCASPLPDTRKKVMSADLETRAWAVLIDTTIVTYLGATLLGKLNWNLGWLTTPVTTLDLLGESFEISPLIIALMIIYHWLFEWSIFGASPGKLIQGLRVCTKYGEHSTGLGALWRSMIRTLSLISGIGVTLAFLEDSVLHDRWTGMTVVSRSNVDTEDEEGDEDESDNDGDDNSELDPLDDS